MTDERQVRRRLLPLRIGVGLQGFMLWVPVEKLFQTQIGFDAAAIAVMAAAYAAVVPLLEVPSGILADRSSRTAILIVSSVAAAASALLGGLSHDVATYVVAALILGVYFAMNSGTVDSVVYDTVVEETGSADRYERWIGRVRMVESATFTTSALAGALLAGVTSPRVAYFVTVPFVLASIVAFCRFREPRLHRAAEPVRLRRHITTTVHAMSRVPDVRRVLLLAALIALLSQAVFEFGPLWLVALHAPSAAFGPYWALLVATGGAGGYLAARLRLDRRAVAVPVAGLLAAVPVLLATSHSVIVVVAAQTVLQLVLAVAGIHAGRLLHDAVPSAIRAGVSSGAGTCSWLLFLPFSVGFGALARAHGVAAAAWLLGGTCVVLAVLVVLATGRSAPVQVQQGPDGGTGGRGVRADQVGEAVDQQQAAAGPLFAGCGPATGQRVGEMPGVAYLAGEVIVVGPDPHPARPVGVVEAVGDQFGDDQLDVGHPARGYPRVPGVMGGEPADAGQFGGRGDDDGCGLRGAVQRPVVAGDDVVRIVLVTAVPPVRLPEDGVGGAGVGHHLRVEPDDVVGAHDGDVAPGERGIDQRFVLGAGRVLGGRAAGPDRLADDPDVSISVAVGEPE